MQNYYSPLASINNLDVAHLSEKGAANVQELIDYVRPRYQSIIDGATAKQEVARFYLERSGDYTDGANKLITNIITALGISKGYISKIKSADKYLETLHLDTLKTWVSEHPITCQYYIAKQDHQTTMDKFTSGSHFSRTELEVNAKEAKELKPAEQPTPEIVEEVKSKTQELIDDPSRVYINTISQAATALGSVRGDLIAATMDTVSRIKYMDSKREKQLRHLIKLCNEALAKPEYVPQPLSSYKS